MCLSLVNVIHRPSWPKELIDSLCFRNNPRWPNVPITLELTGTLCFKDTLMYYQGKKLFAMVFKTYLLLFICVLMLIFIYLVSKKLKRFLLDIKEKIYVVFIMFFF